MLDPFSQALTTRNVVVDESNNNNKKKNLYPSKPPNSVSLITSFPVPGYFLGKYDYGDDDDDIITEFSTSCPLLVL